MRVKAIVPIVLDAIHFRHFAHHQFKSYGGYSYAFEDWYHMDIMARLDTPQMLTWAARDDPFSFTDRLTMPKLIVNAAMDEFQQVFSNSLIDFLPTNPYTAA